jgi:nucleotide-binding universal stress UspA family protein
MLAPDSARNALKQAKPEKRAGRTRVMLKRKRSVSMRTKPLPSKPSIPKTRPQSGTTKVPDAFHIRKILAPTDFSEHSRKALAYAKAFARKFGAEIVLLHVVEPLPYTADYGYGVVTLQQPDEIVMTGAKGRLKAWGRAKGGAEAFAEPILRSGTPHHEIVVCARETDADLIIIGTHGHSGLDHLLLGSVAERVVRNAPCPVLVVRGREREFVTSS